MAKRKPRTKRVTMLVTVTVPRWMTAAHARREVRTNILHKSDWLNAGPDYQQFDGIKRVAVRPAP